jgi:hypothetical protein
MSHSTSSLMRRLILVSSTGLLAIASTSVWSHGSSAHDNKPKAHNPALHHPGQEYKGHAYHHGQHSMAKEQKDWGIGGDAKDVTRTIEIHMTDNMRFAPSQITVKRGETVRLVAVNKGQVLHEIVIGTPEELAHHAELMKSFPTWRTTSLIWLMLTQANRAMWCGTSTVQASLSLHASFPATLRRA